MTVPRAVELIAPPAWRTVDFISDLHLHAGDPATFSAWERYLLGTAADAVFILGDLFEVWIGDDILSLPTAGFENAAAAALKNCAARKPVYVMHGNRDFLIGQDLMARCGTTLLCDPTVLVFQQQRWLLSHGDELCVDDIDYLQFRHQVRAASWQEAFLARPLSERQAIAQDLRDQSENRKKSGVSFADVDTLAARQWLQAAGAETLVHGHTHKPAEHALGDGLRRVVLSDWDAAATLPRLQVLRLNADGMQRINLAGQADSCH